MSRFSHLLPFIQGVDGSRGNQQSSPEKQKDAFMNTPIYTAAVDEFVRSDHDVPSSSLATSASIHSSPSSFHSASSSMSMNLASELVPQYGLIGIRQDLTDADTLAENRLVLANMNVPWSAFICGSQGAGKSHTLSCLLENALVANNAAGHLPRPLAGMVMHYDKHASYATAQVCEAAYLCSSGIQVTVLVSPSNIWAMKDLYSNLPGLSPEAKVKVVPFYLNDNQLDITRILKLMAVDPSAKETPLYMEMVMNLARELAMEGPGAFTYSAFRERLSNIVWAKGQETPLKIRLQLLDLIIAPSSATKTTKPSPAQENIWAFEPGSLTIVDLSDPFLSSDDACALFSICLSIFLEERNKCGRVVVLDEAHKFLTQAGEAKILTEDLLSVIRQQRHTGTRVLIATQEPTLAPELIDLSNATFVHQFLSPRWYEMLKRHLAGANKQDPGDTNTLFDTIVALQTGEALLFCPKAQLDVVDTPGKRLRVKPLGNGYVKIRIRQRLTADGGKSIMAIDASTEAPARTKREDMPMFEGVPNPQNSKKPPTKAIELPSSKTKALIELIKSASNNAQTAPTVPVKSTTPAGSTVPAVLAANAYAPTTTVPKAKLLITEMKRLAQAMSEEVPWTSFRDLTESQRTQLFSSVDTTFQLPPGKAVKDSGLKGYCYSTVGGLDDYMAKLNRLKDPK
ncbi:hypothetical protein F4677DRAFT_455642 [Hypoxylon crocopeplum]|nr:hypothetical protein F4677DRAFT_455642 [Hypoxylon crocopeplum]